MTGGVDRGIGPKNRTKGTSGDPGMKDGLHAF